MRHLGHVDLIARVVVNLVTNVTLTLLTPRITGSAALVNGLFIATLGTITPVLIFILIVTSVTGRGINRRARVQPVLCLCLLNAFTTTIITIITDALFPSGLILAARSITVDTPNKVNRILRDLLLDIISGPIDTLVGTGFVNVLT